MRQNKQSERVNETKQTVNELNKQTTAEARAPLVDSLSLFYAAVTSYKPHTQASLEIQMHQILTPRTSTIKYI